MNGENVLFIECSSVSMYEFAIFTSFLFGAINFGDIVYLDKPAFTHTSNVVCSYYVCMIETSNTSVQQKIQMRRHRREREKKSELKEDDNHKHNHNWTKE